MRGVKGRRARIGGERSADEDGVAEVKAKKETALNDDH